MKINVEESKTVVISTKKTKKTQDSQEVIGESIEQVTLLNYLDTVTEKSGKIDSEINQRPGKPEKLQHFLRTTDLGKKEIPE